MLKKILSLLMVFFMLFLFTACNDQSINYENLSNRKFKSIYENYDKYPINMGYINGKNYGRVVSSSSSIEEAFEVVTNHFTDDSNIVVGINLDIETQFFYGVYVKWEHNSSGQLSYFDEFVISYKKDIFDCKMKRSINDDEYYIFTTKDTLIIKQIMDYIYYSETYEISGSKLFFSEVTETDDSFIYKSYGSRSVFGDFGLQDKIYLVRTIWEINKSTKELGLLSEDTIKTIYVDGILTHY